MIGGKEQEEMKEATVHIKDLSNEVSLKQSNQEMGLCIGTLNIVDGHGNRLELACGTLSKLGVDIAILTETKITDGKHTCLSFGYDIFATKAKSIHQGGVALLARNSMYWHLEGIVKYGPNVIKSTLVHDKLRTTIVGAYIPPSKTDLSTVKYIDLAMKNVDLDNVILL